MLGEEDQISSLVGDMRKDGLVALESDLSEFKSRLDHFLVV